MPATHLIPQTDKQARTFVVAVAGNPNSGKTTLFNALTGLRHRVGNYPGVTVEKREGALSGEPAIRLLDLPGTYSLSARSPDEHIAREVLLGQVRDTPPPDAVLVVIDASNLERNLYLATQIIELGPPVVIAANMMDLAEQAGHRLDVEKLSQGLGVPVIPTVGHRKQGTESLRAALARVCRSVTAAPLRRRWVLPESVEREVAGVARAISDSGFTKAEAADAAALLLLADERPARPGHLPGAVSEAVAAAQARLSEHPEIDLSFAVTTARYAWLGQLVEPCISRSERPVTRGTDRLDRVLTHRVWGLLVLGGVMIGMFYSIFALADPLIGLIERLVGFAQTTVADQMAPGLPRDLIADGIMAGVGGVIVFLPQICILFLFIALLEDSGYMSRAVFVMDRIMRRLGLPGKSFIPLLSCHACAIPGIMATRTIEGREDRLATILVAPLMTCSARLPVYTVLIAACLPGSAWAKAGVLVAMYALGMVTALVMASLFKRTLLKGPRSALVMELPPYRVPRIGPILRVMWDRSAVFLTRAGTIILAMSILLWAMMSFPRGGERAAAYDARRAAVRAAAPADLQEQLAAIDRQQAAEALRHSLAGRLGRLIEPAIRPLGYDWRIGVGIIGSFAAREVFVSTMSIVYSVGEADETAAPLREQLRAAAWPDGRRVFTPLVAVGLMVFYVLACQCAGTIAVVRRETNSWRWPAFMFAYMSTLAYVAALLIYQIGSALGLGGA